MKVKFYLKASGRSPIEDFLKEIGNDLRNDFLDAVVQLEQGHNLSLPLSRNLSSIHKGLHELRLKDRAGAYRFFYFIKKAWNLFCARVQKENARASSKRN